MLKVFKFLFLFFFILPFEVSLAQTKAARVIIVRGKVFGIEKGTEPKQLKKGDWLSEGATVKTEAKSFVKLLFIDKSSINVGPNGSMVISKFDTKKAGIISVLKGKVRSKVQKDFLKKSKDNKSKLFIKTKNAAMGVRGTDFQTGFDPATGATSLEVITGQVALVNISDMPETLALSQDNLERAVTSPNAVLVEKGFSSNISGGKAKPSPPQKIPKSQLGQLQKSETFGLKSEEEEEKEDKKKEDKKEAKKEDKKEEGKKEEGNKEDKKTQDKDEPPKDEAKKEEGEKEEGGPEEKKEGGQEGDNPSNEVESEERGDEEERPGDEGGGEEEGGKEEGSETTEGPERAPSQEGDSEGSFRNPIPPGVPIDLFTAEGPEIEGGDIDVAEPPPPPPEDAPPPEFTSLFQDEAPADDEISEAGTEENSEEFTEELVDEALEETEDAIQESTEETAQVFEDNKVRFIFNTQ